MAARRDSPISKPGERRQRDDHVVELVAAPPRSGGPWLVGGAPRNPRSSCCSTRHVSCDSRSFTSQLRRRICCRFQPMPDACSGSNTISASRRWSRHHCARWARAGTRAGSSCRPRRKCRMVSIGDAAAATSSSPDERGQQHANQPRASLRAAPRSARARRDCRPRGSRAPWTRRVGRPARERARSLLRRCAARPTDPGVLAAAAELHRHDQRLVAGGDARQPPGQHRVRRPSQAANTRSTTCRGSKPPCVCDRARSRESTCSCATNCVGLRFDPPGQLRARRVGGHRGRETPRAGRTRGNVGLITSCSRCSST